MNKPYILIPAYQPNESLLKLVDQLLQAGMNQIIVIDDGSGEVYQSIFSQLPNHIIVLQHTENQGKGAALKTGLRYIQEKNLTVPVITVDADGQHLLSDIQTIYQTMINQPGAFVLGVRQFGKEVPWRSKFGNELTKKIFLWLYKYPLEDTQTGLRGIPCELQQRFLEIQSDHYEFESECLIIAIKTKANIVQIPISTVYIENNASSHFNPLVDSIKIYFVFFRYCIIALLSFLIDFSIFAMLHWITHTIFVSLICARLCSSVFNFYQNKYLVYRNHDKSVLTNQFVKYALLAIAIFIASYFGILFLVHIAKWNVLVAKVVIDGMLFVISFLIQKTVVFGERSE